MAVLKRALAVLLCICLAFCCACKNKTPPDKEASVNENGLSPTTPQVITEEMDASKGLEATLSAEQLSRAFSYSFLSEQEKRIYRIMLNMVQHLTEGWIDIGEIEINHNAVVSRVFRAMCNDFPEYYWMPSSYYIAVNGSNVAISFKRNEAENCYGFSKKEIDDNKLEFDDAIERILYKINETQTDFEKEVIIHDLLCKRVVYDSEFDRQGENTVYTAYGALVNGHAVCEGYARAFKLLCYYAGLECILITGDSKGAGHMWNMVKLEGNWYHVDVTWDDLRSEPHHTYLNLTELQIRADHNIDVNFSDILLSNTIPGNSYNFSVPAAQETSQNYFIKKGLIINDDPINIVADEIVARFKGGAHHAEFAFASDDIAEDFKANYEIYVVEIQKKCLEKTIKLKFKLKTLSFTENTCVIYFEEV